MIVHTHAPCTYPSGPQLYVTELAILPHSGVKFNPQVCDFFPTMGFFSFVFFFCLFVGERGGEVQGLRRSKTKPCITKKIRLGGEGERILR